MPQPLPMFSFTMPELQARMRDFVYRPRPLAETEERNEEYALLIQFSNWLSSRPAEGLEEAIFGVAPWQKDHALRWDKLHRLGWFGEHPQETVEGGNEGMKTHTQISRAAISFPRADAEALAQFDERTKSCHMQCGRHTLDPRTWKECLFLCTDCCVEVRPPPAENSKVETWVSVTRELDEADAKLWVEVARQMAVLWEPLGPVGNVGKSFAKWSTEERDCARDAFANWLKKLPEDFRLTLTEAVAQSTEAEDEE